MKASSPTLRAVVSRVASSWLPKTKHWLLFLIFLLASTQFGLHFWPTTALVYGLRVDYLSPTLYFLDILILLFLLLNRDLIKSKFFLLPIPPLLVNLLYSQNPLSTLNWSFHLLLYLIFLFSIPKKMLILVALPTLAFGMFFQVVLGATQVVLGHSLQGFIYYLGERAVSAGQPGIAQMSILNQIVLRAYGTFGHPNTFAGWLVVVFLIIQNLHRTQKNKSLLSLGIYLSTFVMVIVGIFLTQSRAAALSFFGLVIPFSLLKSFRSRLAYYAIFLILIFYNITLFSPPRSDLSLAERLNLQQLSLQVVKKYPLFGTGINASISTYPEINPSFRLLQPDHNSFTLFLSWFGVVGVLTLIYLIRTNNFIALRLYNLFPLLPLLLFDHYLLTSPQGLFILVLYLNVVHYSHAQNDRQ